MLLILEAFWRKKAISELHTKRFASIYRKGLNVKFIERFWWGHTIIAM